MSISARNHLQNFWRNTHRVSLLGMGFMNADAALNGEQRFLNSWLHRWQGVSEFTIFDVGANDGDFAESCRRACPTARIHAFEPNPQTYGRLEGRFRDDRRVRTSRVALGDERTRAVLFDYEGARGTEHATLTAEAFDAIYHTQMRGVQVDVLTIDDYVAQEGLERIDYLKIDTEGHELPVLKGARQMIADRSIGCIQFEWNSHHALRGDTFYEVGQLLPYFDIFRILPNGLAPIITQAIPYSPKVEIYRYANYVAVPRD